MKTTKKSIHLDQARLFGFNQPGSGKKNSKTLIARPMIGGKAVGSKTPPVSPSVS